MAGNGVKITDKKRRKKHHHRRHNNHQNRYQLQKQHQQQQEHLSPLISLLASATTAAHTFLTQNDLHLLPSQTLTLESKITSTAHSLTKLHSLLQPLNHSKPLKSPTPPPPPPPQCWFQRFLSTASSHSKSQWVEAFRMSKPSFDLLLQTLTPSLQNSISNLPVDYILAATLFRLAHGGSYKAVGRRFGIDSETACLAFYEVCKAVNDELGHLFELSTDLKRIVEGFGWISLPNCCGVLGFNRFFIEGGASGKTGAVIVQGLVDSEGRFLDVSAGWPSTMSPSTILRQTKLFARVEESKELFNGALFELENGNLIPQYILGESCCPLLPWLLTPYPVSNMDDDLNSNSSEQAFNSVHNRGTELVSTAFARVRGCWRLLSMRWKEECIEFLPFVIVTSCLLHNFLIKCGEGMTDANDIQFGEHEFPGVEGKGNVNGERIRDVLAWQLCLEG